MTEPIDGGAAATYATPTYVLDMWIGSDKPESSELVQSWLTEAQTLLFADRDLPDLEERLADDESGKLAALVAIAERRMVTRALKNPDNARQVNSTTGPYTDSYTLATETFTGLEVTADELKLLSSSAGSRAGTASTLPHDVPGHPLFGALVNGPLSWAPGGWE